MGVRYIPCLGFRSEVQASSPLGRRRYSLRPNLNPKPYTLNPWTLTSIADSAPAQQAFLEVANAPCQCLRGRGRGRGRACTIPRISVGGIPQQSACDGQRYARLFSATSVTSAGFGTDAGVHSSSGSHSVPACATTRNAAPAVTCVCVCVCARACFPVVGMRGRVRAEGRTSCSAITNWTASPACTRCRRSPQQRCHEKSLGARNAQHRQCNDTPDARDHLARSVSSWCKNR